MYNNFYLTKLEINIIIYALNKLNKKIFFILLEMFINIQLIHLDIIIKYVLLFISMNCVFRW